MSNLQIYRGFDVWQDEDEFWSWKDENGVIRDGYANERGCHEAIDQHRRALAKAKETQ